MERERSATGEAPSSGGWGREGVRSEERAEQPLAPGRRAALPLTRMSLVANRLFQEPPYRVDVLPRMHVSGVAVASSDSCEHFAVFGERLARTFRRLENL